MFQVFTAFRVALVKRETEGYYFVMFACFRDLKNAAKFNAHEQYKNYDDGGENDS